MHTPSDTGPRKEPAVAINSTPAPGGAAALASQGVPSGATAKPPAYAPGTPVFAPERLPSPAKGDVAQPPQGPPSVDPQAPGRGTQGRPDASIADLARTNGKTLNPAAGSGDVDGETGPTPALSTPAARTRSKGGTARTLPDAVQAALTTQLPPGQPFAPAADTVSPAASAPRTAAPGATAPAAAAPAAAATEADNVAGELSAVMDSTRAAPPASAAFVPQMTAKPSAASTPAAFVAAAQQPAASSTGAPAPATSPTPAPTTTAATSDSNPIQVSPARLAAITALPSGSALTPHDTDTASATDTTSSDAAALASVLSTGHTAGDSSGSTEAAALAPPALPMHTPVGSSGWAEQIGARLVWMAHQGVTAASLRMQPEHLGPVEVKLSIRDDGTSVWFGASQPETRAALEQALPQLKVLFSAQGMTLTDAGVSREAPRDAPQAPRSARASNAPLASENATSLSVSTTRRGLVDTYA